MASQDEFRQRVNDIFSARSDPPELVRRLEALSPLELNELLPFLFSTGTAGAEQHAIRDAVQAALYRKLADSLNRSISSLDKSTARLTRVGWWLTVVLGLLGIIVSVVLAIRH